MEQHNYPKLDETLYRTTLANGLQVNLLPKPDYHKTYAVFTTNYGSIDRTFQPIGQSEMVTLPDGIAHFLEHKLFEKKAGDIFEVFGKLGANANAFTSFTRTSYLFSATSRIHENLDTLLDFVQEPYFTEASVEKEKGIIGQEIQMYDDDPNWRLFFGLIQNMYAKHPVRIDIAGTVASIAQITVADLYLAYRTFYQPQNMNLFVVGHIDPETTLAWITANQAKKDFPAPTEPQRQLPEEAADGADIVAHREIEMAVQRPKVMLGIKGLDQVPTGRAGLVYRTSLNLLFEVLFNDSSAAYLKLYDQGILDDTFGYEVDLERSFHFAGLSSDTQKPQEFVQAIQQVLQQATTGVGLTAARLALVKREMLGKFWQSFNSLEYIANQYAGDDFGTASLFDLPEIMAQIQLADLQQVAQQFIRPEAMSVFQINPKAAAK